MQHYELMIIFSPILSEEEYKAIVKKYLSLVKEDEDRIVKSEPWGLKNLAYPINKKTVGLYWVLTYKVKKEQVESFDKNFRIQLSRDENILRYTITKLDKYALEYNLKRMDKKAPSIPATENVEEEKPVA